MTTKSRIIAGGLVVAALLIVPAPLLPPHRLAEAVQSTFNMDWKAAYFVAAMGLQAIFYGTLGVLSAFTLVPAMTLRGRLLQIGLLPLVVVALALVIRSLKMGYLPVWINALIPIAACLLGIGLGLGLLYRHGLA